MLRFTLALWASLMASGAFAQDLHECDWMAMAGNIAEPWEDNTRTFANGNVRLAVLDTIEPAAGAYHLLLLSPPFDEIGERQCRVISLDGGVGFGAFDWPRLDASYDPSVGLTFHVRVQRYDAVIANYVWNWLTFTLNQSTGQINTWLQ